MAILSKKPYLVMKNKLLIILFFFIYPYYLCGQEETIFSILQSIHPNNENITHAELRKASLLGVNKNTGNYEVLIDSVLNIKYIITQKSINNKKVEQGYVEIQGQPFYLNYKHDAINKNYIPNTTDILTMGCNKLKFYNKTYILISSSGQGTTGSFINKRYCYLYDITDINNIKDYYFILDYGNSYSFGDFNKDGNLDICKLHPYPPNLCEGYDSKIYKGCFILKCYTLNNKSNSFIPLNHEKYILLLLFIQKSKVSIIEKKWF